MYRVIKGGGIAGLRLYSNANQMLPEPQSTDAAPVKSLSVARRTTLRIFESST